MNSSLLLISAYLFINSNLIESIKLSSQQTGGADVCQANSKTINGIIKLDDNSFYAFFDFGRYVTKVDGFRQDGAGQPIVSPGFPQPSSILWPNVLTEHSNERLVAAFSSANEQVTFVKRSHNGEFVVLKYTGFKATSQLSMTTLYKDYVNGTHVKKVTYYNGQLWLVVREPAFVTVAIGNNNVNKKVNGRENVRERSIAQLEAGEAILLQGSFWAHLPSNLDIGPLMAYDNYATGVEMKGNDLWFGCPARFCHDGQVDAATTLGGQVLLFRGKYRYLAKSFQDIPAAAAILNQLDEKTNYIADAAFTIKETLYVVRDQGAHAYADGQLGPLMELEGLGGVDYVNGALFDSSTQNIYLFYKSWFAIYHLDEHDKFEKVQWFEKVTKFKGLPGNLDAAVIVSGSIFFFKGNFYYTMAEPELISGGNVQGPFLMQEKLFNCPELEYRSREVRIGMNVTRKADFVKFRKLTQPAGLNSVDISEPEPEFQVRTTTTTTSTTTTEPVSTVPATAKSQTDKSASEQNGGSSLILIVTSLLILIGLFLIGWFLTRKKTVPKVKSEPKVIPSQPEAKADTKEVAKPSRKLMQRSASTSVTDVDMEAFDSSSQSQDVAKLYETKSANDKTINSQSVS